MKKQAIPNTAGQATTAFVEAVRDNIEILTGRRKNKISVPEVRTLTVSSPPTQAELRAMNDYVNAWGMAFKSLVARFDE